METIRNIFQIFFYFSASIAAIVAATFHIINLRKRNRKEEILWVKPIAKLHTFLFERPRQAASDRATIPRRNVTNILSSLDKVCHFKNNIVEIHDSVNFRMFCKLIDVDLRLLESVDYERDEDCGYLNYYSIAYGQKHIKITADSLVLLEKEFQEMKKSLGIL